MALVEVVVCEASEACCGNTTQLEADEARFHKEQEEFRVAHRKSWEVDIEEKRRFLKTLPDKEVFESIIRTRRTAEFAALQVLPLSY